MMKCPSCGAETNGKFCEYCGSELPKDKINVGVCPKCGNSNITFKRERIGTATQRTSRKNVIGTGRTGQSVSQSAYRTVGLCQNCGHTWNPNAGKSGSGRKTWLWVLGWICISPVPLTILLLRKKDMKPTVKYSIIAAAWLLFFAIGISGNSEADVLQTDTPLQTESVQTEQPTDNTTVFETETVTREISLGEYTEDIVAQYNAQATEKLVFVEDFTPSNKDSSHYRTEFRLAAYIDAVGKSYLLGDKVVDLVAAPTIFGETDFRVYASGASLDQVIELIQGMSPIMDKSLTAVELQETITEVSTNKRANGYYYGELGMTLLGSDANGYALMIKND